MLMGRRIRSNLPVSEDLLTPKGAHRVRKEKEEQKVKQKRLHDRTAKHLPMLKPGDTVRLRDISTGTWRQQGQVEEEVAPRSYRIQMESGLSLRRNRTDLQLQQEPTGEDITAQETVQQDATDFTEPASNGPDHAGCSPKTMSASPVTERQLRPKRLIQPPKRLIESC